MSFLCFIKNSFKDFLFYIVTKIKHLKCLVNKLFSHTSTVSSYIRNSFIVVEILISKEND